MERPRRVESPIFFTSQSPNLFEENAKYITPLTLLWKNREV
jgi:hypothetical protein